MEDKTWGTLSTPKIYIELQGEFIDFNKEEEYLVCKFPVQSKYFNPMDTTLGGIIDSYMDVTMGPLSWLLGERVVTKSFSAKYIRPVTADYKYVTAKAWRESVSEKGSIYKAELHLDTDELAAVSEGLFVQPRN